MGRTGSGKTSLLRALLRMYAFEGRITLDGVDVSSLPAQLLRSRLAVVPQVIEDVGACLAVRFLEAVGFVRRFGLLRAW